MKSKELDLLIDLILEHIFLLEGLNHGFDKKATKKRIDELYMKLITIK